MNEPVPTDASQKRRLQGFRCHLAGYAGVMVVLILINVLYTPSEPWFAFVLVAWGAPLAVHAAWAMGLFDSLWS